MTVTLPQALAAAREELQYCRDELDGDLRHEIGFGDMTYADLKALIDFTDFTMQMMEGNDLEILHVEVINDGTPPAKGSNDA